MTVGGCDARRTALERLAAQLVGAWACWAPTLTTDGLQMAYVSDRTGMPSLWVQSTGTGPGSGSSHPRHIPLGDDPVVSAHWSPDGAWLACSVATGGGVRTEVWVVRPDGSDARRVAGGVTHAALGPWAPRGHRLCLTVYEPGAGNRCLLFDPASGSGEEVASGPLLVVLDLSPDERFALLRDGPRGAQRCWLLDRLTGHSESLLPFPTAGSASLGILRPASPEAGAPLVAYLVTDAGLPRRGLVAVPIDPDGHRGHVGAVAQRDDAELELVDADRRGQTLLLAWNAAGVSELELLDASSGECRPVSGLPGAVVDGGVLSRDGSRAVLSIEGPDRPRQIFELTLDGNEWRAVTEPSLALPGLVAPTLERFESHDGLTVEGWLYRGASGSDPGAGSTPPPAVVYVHGGPEAQERPVFSPHHQLLAAAGITVFAPNIRGSSGYGRAFVHADDRFGRLDAIADVAASAAHLVQRGLAHPDRVAVSGRSYGGYAVLMALALYPTVFAAGVDICGMSDLLTFYRDTEPWIAQAAVTKYGDPRRDAWLLERLSPMRRLSDIRAPLLVVHGELDTNVPLGEAHQVVAALGELGRRVEYLELVGEGHEYRRAESRLQVLCRMLAFLDAELNASAAAAP